jgi:hypothetical protein
LGVLASSKRDAVESAGAPARLGSRIEDSSGRILPERGLQAASIYKRPRQRIYLWAYGR